MWVGSGKFSLLPGKLFSSDINVLTNGLKICPEWWKNRHNYYRGNYSNVFDPLTCWLS